MVACSVPVGTLTLIIYLKAVSPVSSLLFCLSHLQNVNTNISASVLYRYIGGADCNHPRSDCGFLNIRALMNSLFGVLVLFIHFYVFWSVWGVFGSYYNLLVILECEC